MEILNYLRKYSFWMIDSLKGGTIYNHYKDIKHQYNNYHLKESVLKRTKNLNNLLRHATNTVEFYKNIDDVYGLSSFPIINKNIIKENIKDFISIEYQNKKLYSTTTSGSTGTPFTVYRDLNKIKRHQAENIYFSELAGYNLGSKLYYLRVWNEVNKKSYLTKLFQNIEMIEISNLSDFSINNFLDKLHEDKEIKSMLSFASSLEVIARHIEKQKTSSHKKSNMSCIIAMSEPITDHAKRVIENYFACPVISRYSNMENGFIAQQEPHGSIFKINHASFYIEILDLNEDKVIENGKLGRIVITDLFNYAMPLIRYDTGDLGILKIETDNKDKSNGPYLLNIEGRIVDFITNTKGQILSPHSITNTMWKFSEILQFQFIQIETKKYIIKINIDAERYDMEEILIADLKKYLGDDASIELVIVHEIPMLASGKRKKIVNLVQHSK